MNRALARLLAIAAATASSMAGAEVPEAVGTGAQAAYTEPVPSVLASATVADILRAPLQEELTEAPAVRVVRPDATWARITVDRAADMVGRPAFRAATPLLGRGSSIRFSARPVIDIIGGTASLPGRMPVAARLSSGFGMRGHPILGGRRPHLGIDLAAPFGSPVAATSDGVVRIAGWQGGYGLLVAVAHAGGLETRYGHLSRLSVVPGQNVRSGEVIGFVGSTGRSTGAHLHYETRIYGTAINPLGSSPRRR